MPRRRYGVSRGFPNPKHRLDRSRVGTHAAHEIVFNPNIVRDDMHDWVAANNSMARRARRPLTALLATLGIDSDGTRENSIPYDTRRLPLRVSIP